MATAGIVLSTSRHTCDPRVIRSRLDTPWAKVVQEKGYSYNEVQVALEEQFAQSGRPKNFKQQFLGHNLTIPQYHNY